MWEDIFFGVSEEELPYIPFIDRINLYFKGNSLVEFSDEEMPYVMRAGQTKTFREVVDLAVESYEFSKQKQEEKDEDFQAPPEQDKDSNTTADDEVQVGNTEDEDKE